MTEPTTATALIDAAEALFAQDGIDGASLRAVMRTAGTDPGAVHYHFGGRQELAAAVLDRVLVPLNRRRLELLHDLPAPSVGSLMGALIRPDLEVARDLEERGAGRARLLGAVYLHPDAFVTELVAARFAPVAARFQPHLIELLPAVAPEIIGWRVRWCVFGMLGAVLADAEQPWASGSDELARRLIECAAAAVAAPVNDDPRVEEKR